jgi:PAS domain S-box-containing protein
MIVAESLENILPGKSEMARLMREFDWSTSEVGIPEKWPESLKTAARICISTRNPVVLWWGASFTQFYNDAFISFLGPRKHPAFLGRSGRVCWNEIWETMGPMWERVFATGEATWSEDFLYVLDRNLPREEGYFTFSYTPLRDDTGKIAGIFCPCHETTERVIGERRLRTLRDLGRAVAIARTPEAACKSAADVLATNPQDIPFSLTYLLNDGATQARLVATSGFAHSSEARHETIDLTSAVDGPIWPLKRALENGSAETVSDLSNRFGQLPGGSWPESPETALIMPIASAGQSRGFLVAGFSPRRIVDADYRSFFDLIAGHISTAVTNATVYEEERKRAEALAELDRAKTTFFSNISHEFRTPLTLLLGPLEDEIRRRPETSPNLEVASRNARRLLKLVNTLLEFSRIESSRAKATYRQTDLAALTTDLASNFRSLMEKAGLEFRVHCLELREPVYVDRDMWERIVLNLVSNAFKFTFEGSVTVALVETGDRVELSVSDTGTGIPQHELAKIFDRFHRIEGAKGRTIEGTGIGLALVRDLVELHGGLISVESEVGRGSRFKVSIPFGTAHLPKQQVMLETPAASPISHAVEFTEEAMQWLAEDTAIVFDEQRGKTKRVGQPPNDVESRSRILLADDNADMRQYIRHVLGDRYELAVAGNGEEALARALAHPPDLILADVMMPRMDGFELIRKLRASEATSTIPIMVLSARAGDEARVEGLGKGADDYLIKPFSAAELRARVDTHLSLAAARKRAENAIRIANERLRESEANLRITLGSLSDAVIATDGEGHVRYMNSVAETLTGWKQSEAAGKRIEEVYEVMTVHNETVRESNARRVLERAEAAPRKRFLLQSHQGRQVPVEEAATPILDGDRVIGAVTVFADITERMKIEQILANERVVLEEQMRIAKHELGESRTELQQLSGHLMMAQEEERQHLANELHDDLGQRTAVVEMTVKRLEDDMGTDAFKHQELLQLLSTQVSDLAHGLRAASHRLHPSVLENLGLSTALRMLVEEQRGQNGEARFIERGASAPLPASHTTALYRIAQEGLRNAAKHALGAPVRLTLIYRETGVELSIEDAGGGFDLGEIQGKRGLGLLSMQERARSIGATFILDSTIGEGTNIRVSVPLASGEFATGK